MIGAGNGCGGSAGCVPPPSGGGSAPTAASQEDAVCRDSRVALPSPPGDFNDSTTFPAMITEDEQWFDYWGYGNVERSVASVAYGVASFMATGGAMHNYYMWHILHFNIMYNHQLFRISLTGFSLALRTVQYDRS